MRFLRVVMLLVLTLGLQAVLEGFASAAPISTPPSDCSSSFDPYAYTPSALSSCGIKTFPRTSVTQLSDGGSSYNYQEPGGIVAQGLVPPYGFDPTTATNAQLRANGFPPRPAATAALAKWERLVTTGHAASQPSFLAALPNTQADIVYSAPWSGYVVTGSFHQFYDAEMEYNEPRFGNSVCPTNEEVTWAGIGGWYNDGLEQAGTAHNVSGMSNHQGWYEVWPLQNINPLNFYASYGDDVDALAYENSPTQFFFALSDYTNNTYKSLTVNVPSGYWSGTAGEGIAERPRVNGVLTDLSNFGTLNVIDSWANDFSIDTYPPAPSGSRHGAYMTNNGTSSGRLMAYPGPIGSYGAFSDTQTSCH